MRYDRSPNREQAGAVGWVSLADALIVVLIIVLTVSLLATGALQASRQENTRLRNTLAVDPDAHEKAMSELRALRERVAEAVRTEAELRAKLLAHEGDKDALATARKRIEELEQKVLLIEGDKLALAKKLADLEATNKALAAQLTKAEDDNKLLKKEHDALKKERDAALAAAKDLAAKIDLAKKDQESKFEGIATTGARVVFLVDTSGSMGKLDLTTAAPEKWALVADTVARVMRTIPTLKEYQVITFSSQAQWLAGAGGWQKYDKDKSPDAVKKALLEVVPKDDTNLYVALDKAFRLRADGLDTIYLFSDGLPTSGPGLTQAQENANPPLSETDRSTILAKHLRKTLASDWNRVRPGAARVTINSIGFFFESPDLGSFLWALSRENGGSFVGMSKP